ncbi:hypothetical protein Ancab_001102 [Ancistrocladus abbreviatus]
MHQLAPEFAVEAFGEVKGISTAAASRPVKMEAQEGNSSDIRRPETEVGSANASNTFTSSFIEDFNDVPPNQGDFDHSAIDLSVCPSKKENVLMENSSFFADRLSSKQVSGFSCLEIEDCEDIEIYVSTMGLMYCKDMKQMLIKLSVLFSMHSIL